MNRLIPPILNSPPRLLRPTVAVLLSDRLSTEHLLLLVVIRGRGPGRGRGWSPYGLVPGAGRVGRGRPYGLLRGAVRGVDRGIVRGRPYGLLVGIVDDEDRVGRGRPYGLLLVVGRGIDRGRPYGLLFDTPFDIARGIEEVGARDRGRPYGLLFGRGVVRVRPFRGRPYGLLRGDRRHGRPYGLVLVGRDVGEIVVRDRARPYGLLSVLVIVAVEDVAVGRLADRLAGLVDVMDVAGVIGVVGVVYGLILLSTLGIVIRPPRRLLGVGAVVGLPGVNLLVDRGEVPSMVGPV